MDNYTRLLKIQKFSEELIELQENITAIDNEISISEKNIEEEKKKIANLLSKKNNNLLKIKQINAKTNTIKNEISESKGEKPVCVGYVRLSKKDKKHFERQYHTIYNSHFNIVKVFNETISAHNVELSKRLLNECVDYCYENGIRYIIVSEVARLCRNVNLFGEICSLLIDKHINIYSCSEHLYLFDDEFNVNDDFYNKIIDAEKEVEQIHNRLSQGRELYKSKGGTLGRRKGSVKTLEQLQKEYPNQINLLREGVSIRKVAYITNVSTATVQMLKRKFNITSQKQNDNMLKITKEDISEK